MNRESHILLTGATGFLGQYILDALIEDGFSDIHIISSKKRTKEYGNAVTFHTCDLLDLPALMPHVEKADIVINAAGFISYDKSDYKELYEKNVVAVENIANCCIENANKKLIHISSTAAFPRHPSIELVEESHRYNDRNFPTQYAMTKYMGEAQIWRAQAEGVHCYILNPALILGAGDWNTGTPNFFKKINNGLKYFPSGGNGVVYARDVARFILGILNSWPDTSQFILSENNYSYKHLFTKIAERLGTPPPYLEIKGVYKWLARWIDWVQHLSTTESRHLTRQGIHNISIQKAYDNSLSLSMPDFSYTTLEETIQEIALSYLKSIK